MSFLRQTRIETHTNKKRQPDRTSTGKKKVTTLHAVSSCPWNSWYHGNSITLTVHIFIYIYLFIYFSEPLAIWNHVNATNEQTHTGRRGNNTPVLVWMDITKQTIHFKYNIKEQVLMLQLRICIFSHDVYMGSARMNVHHSPVCICLNQKLVDHRRVVHKHTQMAFPPALS